MLRIRLQSDLREAARAGEDDRAAALRLVLAALRDREVAEAGDGGPGDADALEIIACTVRQCEESIAAAEAEGDGELARRKERERDVLAAYLPPPMDDSAVDRAVEEAIAAAAARSIRDIGRTVERLRETCEHPADLARASRRARRRLAS